MTLRSFLLRSAAVWLLVLPAVGDPARDKINGNFCSGVNALAFVRGIQAFCDAFSPSSPPEDVEVKNKPNGTVDVDSNAKPFGTNLSTANPNSLVQSLGPSGPAPNYRIATADTAAASTAQTPPAGKANRQAAIDDFNGDGVTDGALITFSGITVTLFNADGTILSTSSYPISGMGPSILTADFNGDGVPDLAVTENDASGQGNVVVLLGKGDGTFGPPAKFPTGPVGPFAFYLATGDFNGDGNADLAVTNEPSAIGTAGNVAVLLGKGDGTFFPAVSYPVGEFPGTIVAADFNGDGKVDLAALDNEVGIANYVNKVWVLRGKGDGTFQPAVSTATGTGSGYLSFVDLNHDGKMDLVIADQLASAMAVMLGNGDGTFQAATEYVASAQTAAIAPVPLNDGSISLFIPDNADGATFIFFVAGDGTINVPQLQTIGSGPTSVVAADLNGDGQPDLVITDAEAGNIYVELATGGGLFASPVTHSLGSQPGALALADLNGDGKPDVIAADATGLDVLLGKGDGTFQPPIPLPIGGANYSFVADFNGDGNLDLAGGSEYGDLTFSQGNGDGTFTVNPNVGFGYPRAVGDLNGDGMLDLVTYFDDYSGAYLTVFLGNGDFTFTYAQTINVGNGGAIALGDFNLDGKLDLAFSDTSQVSNPVMHVLLGNGDGTFGDGPKYSCPLFECYSVLAADINGDGKLDLVSYAYDSQTEEVVVFLGNGNGTFKEQTGVSFLGGISGVADLNDDNKLDLVGSQAIGTDPYRYNLTALLGNGDGTFQSSQIWASGYSNPVFGIGDFNGSGRLGFVNANIDALSGKAILSLFLQPPSTSHQHSLISEK